MSKDTKDKVNHLSTTTTVAPDVEHGMQRLPLPLTYVINQTCENCNPEEEKKRTEKGIENLHQIIHHQLSYSVP